MVAYLKTLRQNPYLLQSGTLRPQSTAFGRQIHPHETTVLPPYPTRPLQNPQYPHP